MKTYDKNNDKLTTRRRTTLTSEFPTFPNRQHIFLPRINKSFMNKPEQKMYLIRILIFSLMPSLTFFNDPIIMVSTETRFTRNTIFNYKSPPIMKQKISK